jgi:ABC-type antimicrobial peptide transport system permease subunit
MRLTVYVLGTIVAVVLLALVVQFLLRYQYVAVGGRSEVVFRVDRFTGATCVDFPNRECPAPWAFWR